MTKSTSSAVVTKGQVSLAISEPVQVTASVIPDTKPAAVELIGPMYLILAQVVALGRLGFTVSIDQAPALFSSNGSGVIVMLPGDPEQSAIDAATQAISDALSREQYVALDAKKRAAIAEKERAEQATRETAKALIEAQITAQQESLRQLQVSLAEV